MIRFSRALVCMGVLLALSGGSALAQDDEPTPGQKVIYKEKTEIDFEGLDINGELVKPQGALLLDRKRASFNPLIKLRTDFNDEMDRSVDEIK